MHNLFQVDRKVERADICCELAPNSHLVCVCIAARMLECVLDIALVFTGDGSSISDSTYWRLFPQLCMCTGGNVAKD